MNITGFFTISRGSSLRNENDIPFAQLGGSNLLHTVADDFIGCNFLFRFLQGLGLRFSSSFRKRFGEVREQNGNQ
jgi:hypothetical protein